MWLSVFFSLLARKLCKHTSYACFAHNCILSSSPAPTTCICWMSELMNEPYRKFFLLVFAYHWIIVVVWSLSHVQLFATLWTVAHQALLSMDFSRQEYWSGLPFPSSGDLPEPGIKPTSPAWQVDSLPLSHLGRPSLNKLCLKTFRHR